MKIVNRWSDAVLWEGEAGSKGEAVIAALRAGADLAGANLRGANLRGADLTDANLTGADLTDANLRGADLAGANLTDADLTGADLAGANLTGADLTGADLTRANLTDANLAGANLTGADLTGADLTRANLTDANLAGANLTLVRDDIWAVLSAAPAEVPGLLAAIREGRINGSSYDGECACLVGTIANVRGCAYEEIPTLRPNSDRPSERFFLGISRGDTPETNQASKLAEGWIVEWIDRMRATFGAGA